ncbi:DUF3102 domain-containing protein [Paraliomyxa miuraensis]|uniref:DUF3102 domain-containing protein n=1 Tax=Paraliomyxa miuraensis TaxID=376150 RepID=UPI002259C241|nr:DUF3102 domain-containing protein [Paraliomyxa miuraensis]MCX4241839.1 DUF3102 domain-containing protein [Paraliomyxa miuraensis]
MPTLSPTRLVPLPWQRNREVARLTREILDLQRDAAGKVVDAVIQMGARMRQIQAALDHGQWIAWLRSAVPFDRRTVTRAMRLSEWAEAEPRELERLGHLGPTKLAMLAPLPPEHRRTLTRRTVPIVIPGHDWPKTIDVMTVIELGAAIGGLVAKPAPPKPIGKLVQGARHRIAGLDAMADELVRRKDEDDAAKMLEGLRAVLAELEAAFEG